MEVFSTIGIVENTYFQVLDQAYSVYFFYIQKLLRLHWQDMSALTKSIVVILNARPEDSKLSKALNFQLDIYQTYLSIMQGRTLD